MARTSDSPVLQDTPKPPPSPPTTPPAPMAFNMNPYTQGFQQQNWGTAPSVFGALPSLPVTTTPPRSIQPDSVTFQFTQFNTTVLNCQVVGPQSRVAYRIVTEATTPSCTIWKDNESRNIAMVQWQPNATLEIRGVTPRQRIRDWLRLSPDQSQRTMEVRGIHFAWAPIDGFICLYRTQTSAPKVLARVARAPSMVLLELTQEAMQMGLLEPCLVATVLFVCGHNID
ncbi:hypothetical protein PsYK624_012840 [Phanerochaete sordida]|uniref:DUF6593 domain-containing protein n=1 Tax=Phanerochaete sordida TaxID=48140 RepID=A0A9P3FZ04_9APHY|nr:hypothetical protein PsYK624_012840 [Phanerochaete sordida]